MGGPPDLRTAPHHDGSSRYVPDQAPRLGDRVAVFLRVPAGAPADRVVVRYVSDGEPRYAEAAATRRGGAPGGPVGAAGGPVAAAGGPVAAAAETWWCAEIPLRNPVTRYRFLLAGGRDSGGYRWHNALGTFGHDVPDTHDFRIVCDDPPPAWARDAVIYEVFPDRFARSARAADRVPPDWAVPCGWDDPVEGSGPRTPYQLYGGDLDGVADHLDHIAGLGATAVYLTPFFPARSNHRYDASSFDRVDPLLGGDAALARLAAALHRRGMRLIGDVTTNHCGAEHDWFTAASADPNAAERDMFYFAPDGSYESWWGFPSLPKLNWHSAELRRRFLGTAAEPGVVGRWLSILDGWRVDVANMTGRNGTDELTAEVAALVRAATGAARGDALLVAEHNHDASADLDRGGWHGTMNYAGFTRPVWCWLRGANGAGAGTGGLRDFLGVPVPPPGVPGPAAVATMSLVGSLTSWRSRSNSWILLGSHDTQRVRSVLGSADLVAVAAGLLLTMPGIPMLYAGDEWGLTGRNGEEGRRPMPWHRPQRQDRATQAVFRDLIALRHRLPALREGGLRWAYADADALVLLRETAEQTAIVLARRSSGAPVWVPGLAGAFSPGRAENVYGGASALRPDPDGGVRLPGDGPTFQVWLAG